MRKPSLLFAGLTVAGVLALAGCSGAATDATATSTSEAAVADTSTESTTTQTVAASTDVLTEVSYAELGVKEVEIPFDETSAVDITLSDSGSTGGDGVTVDGDTVTITAGGTYRVSGTLSAGQLVVATDDDDVNLILDGVDITSTGTAAIDIEAADEVVIWLADGSTNTLADASTATAPAEDDTESPNATLYSTANLWIAGTGALAIDAVAEDGITSKDGLVIEGGTITVTAPDEGIRGKDHLVITDGDITVDAGGDGLKSDNEDVANADAEAVGVVWISGGTIDVTAGVDTIEAYRQVTIEGGEITLSADDDGITTEGVVRVSDGTLDIVTSYEGIEGGVILLSGGTGSVTSSDDGINVNGGTDGGTGGMDDRGGMPGGARPSSDTSTTSTTSTVTTAAYSTTASSTDGATDATTVAGPGGGMETAAEGRYFEISGGTWVIDAEGDGLDSNGTASITGGTVVVNGPTNNGNGPLDVNGEFTVSGGTLAASGSSGMLVSPTSTGDQGVLTIAFASSIAAGTPITVTDADGTVVASFTNAKTSQSLVLSLPGIVAGETYTVTADATVTGTSIGGLVVDGTATGGDELGTLTAE